MFRRDLISCKSWMPEGYITPRLVADDEKEVQWVQNLHFNVADLCLSTAPPFFSPKPALCWGLDSTGLKGLLCWGISLQDVSSRSPKSWKLWEGDWRCFSPSHPTNSWCWYPTFCTALPTADKQQPTILYCFKYTAHHRESGKYQTSSKNCPVTLPRTHCYSCYNYAHGYMPSFYGCNFPISWGSYYRHRHGIVWCQTFIYLLLIYTFCSVSFSSHSLSPFPF